MYKQQYTINGMDVLRIVAMTMVLVIHWGQFVFADGSFIRKVTNLGGYGVPIFFAMSGFLITLSLSKVKTLDKERIGKVLLKTLLPHCAALLLYDSHRHDNISHA